MLRQRITTHTALRLLIACFLAMPVLVHAGLLDSWLQKDADERPTRARFDREQPQAFDAGTLSIDLKGNWKLGGSSLIFTEESIVRMDGRELSLRDLRMGQEARVVGARLGNGTVVVRRLTVESQRRRITELGALEAGTSPVGELAPDAPR